MPPPDGIFQMQAFGQTSKVSLVGNAYFHMEIRSLVSASLHHLTTGSLSFTLPIPRPAP
jgi:hypothetical protein